MERQRSNTCNTRNTKSKQKKKTQIGVLYTAEEHPKWTENNKG